MSSSRILAAVALASIILSACGGPGNGTTSPGTMPQTNAVGSASQPGADQVVKVRLFWRPDRLRLQKGEKQSVKLFYSGRRRLLIADDCTGNVVIGQIGFARIKRYHINIYQALALRSGPFHCAVLAKIKDEQRHAVLHIDVEQ